MDIRIAAQIAGLTDYRTDEPSDHPITSEERAMAIEVGYEIAAHHGIDLAAHVAAQHKAESDFIADRICPYCGRKHTDYTPTCSACLES